MGIIESKDNVEKFLIQVHNIINAKEFDINRNFYIMIDRRQYIEGHKYTNKDTLISLNYNAIDVLNEIKNLGTENYKETIIDNKSGRKKPFYCFIKYIKDKQVYIKIKISEEKENQVFCISFHFAEYNVETKDLPYNTGIT